MNNASSPDRTGGGGTAGGRPAGGAGRGSAKPVPTGRDGPGPLDRAPGRPEAEAVTGGGAGLGSAGADPLMAVLLGSGAPGCGASDGRLAGVALGGLSLEAFAAETGTRVGAEID
jgi:hypothetical protein